MIWRRRRELESLALLGVNLVDTLDADDKGELGLGRDVVAALLLGDTAQADLLALCIAVLLDIGLGALEDGLTLGLVLLLCTVSTGTHLIVKNEGVGKMMFSPERWLTNDSIARRLVAVG